MFAASPVPSPAESLVNHASPHALVLARRTDTDDLDETIAALAARLHAATNELLVLLREFDERSGWNNGFLSCAHWRHWRTGVDLAAFRAAPLADAMPTTWNTGPTAASRASTTSCSCADAIIAWCRKADSA